MKGYKEIDGFKLFLHPDISTQVYITAKARWERLTPMSHWRQFFEPLVGLNLKRVRMRSVFFEMPVVCKIGFLRAEAQTPLTEDET